MSERNFDTDMLHGYVRVSALSHACIRATPPGGVYRSAPSGTFSATAAMRKRLSQERGRNRTIPPTTTHRSIAAHRGPSRPIEARPARRGRGAESDEIHSLKNEQKLTQTLQLRQPPTLHGHWCRAQILGRMYRRFPWAGGSSRTGVAQVPWIRHLGNTFATLSV